VIENEVAHNEQALGSRGNKIPSARTT